MRRTGVVFGILAFATFLLWTWADWIDYARPHGVAPAGEKLDHAVVLHPAEHLAYGLLTALIISGLVVAVFFLGKWATDRALAQASAPKRRAYAMASGLAGALLVVGVGAASRAQIVPPASEPERAQGALPSAPAAPARKRLAPAARAEAAAVAPAPDPLKIDECQAYGVCAQAAGATGPEPGTATASLAAPLRQEFRQLQLLLVSENRIKPTRELAVLQPYYFCYRNGSGANVVRIERRYVTDFGSTPALLRPLIPSFGGQAEASLVHDWLYASRLYDRKTADEVMLYAMRNTENPSYRTNRYGAYLIYKAARLGGAFLYGDRDGRGWRDAWVDDSYARGGEAVAPDPRRSVYAFRVENCGEEFAKNVKTGVYDHLVDLSRRLYQDNSEPVRDALGTLGRTGYTQESFDRLAGVLRRQSRQCVSGELEPQVCERVSRSWREYEDLEDAVAVM